MFTAPTRAESGNDRGNVNCQNSRQNHSRLLQYKWPPCRPLPRHHAEREQSIWLEKGRELLVKYQVLPNKNIVTIFFLESNAFVSWGYDQWRLPNSSVYVYNHSGRQNSLWLPHNSSVGATRLLGRMVYNRLNRIIRTIKGNFHWSHPHTVHLRVDAGHITSDNWIKGKLRRT